jgi:hypothetical protein
MIKMIFSLFVGAMLCFSATDLYAKDYCITYTLDRPGVRLTETLVMGFPDTWETPAPELQAFVEPHFRPATIVSFLPNSPACRPTPTASRVILPAPKISPAQLATEAVRIEEVSWNKTEDAPADGNIFHRRRQYIDSKLLSPRSGEMLCGWSILQTRLTNAVWKVMSVSPTSGARFYVRIPSNTRLEGTAIVAFKARFVKKAAIPSGVVLQCSESAGASVWRMDDAERNAYSETLYDQGPVPGPTCVTPEGQGYYCDRPPPAPVRPSSGPACGLNCRSF